MGIQQVLAAQGAAAGGDPDYASVVSLMHFEGLPGGTIFTDQKLSPWGWSGNAQTDTTQFKFGTSSLRLDGSADSITTVSIAGFQADADFTLELQMRANNVASLKYLATKRNTGTGREWSLYLNASKVNLAVFSSTGTQPVNLTGATTLSTGAWYHIAFTRSGNTWRLFVNGNLDASVTTAFTYGTNTDNVTIGSDPSTAGRDYDGWIDEWRVTKGVARYTANFTPPVAAFPDF